MSIEIEQTILERSCKEMIETILFCLPNAYKGSIYAVGKPPDLVVKRITSGVINLEHNEISWGLPDRSEYNPPGKTWLEYRDETDRPLEAMAWCVENQKSWTSEDPNQDIRSVRLQVEGMEDDYHHMEPVLVHKSNLNSDAYQDAEYPKNFKGERIWMDSDYGVVAVIKIHFKPHQIKIGSDETRVIKKLSRSLGTELLSYQLRQESLNAMQQLATDRLNACDILADSLRNAITKTGIVCSLIKQEMGHLREQWEQRLLEERKEESKKVWAVGELNSILMEFGNGNKDLRDELIKVQKHFLTLSFSPQKGEKWIHMQIESRWNVLFKQCPVSEEKVDEVNRIIDDMKEALYFGKDHKILSDYSKMPQELKEEWVDLIYDDSDNYNESTLDQLIHVLEDPRLDIPTKERSRKTLSQLKALAQTMNQLERNTNFLLRQVLNGGGDENGYHLRPIHPELP